MKNRNKIVSITVQFVVLFITALTSLHYGAYRQEIIQEEKHQNCTSITLREHYSVELINKFYGTSFKSIKETPDSFRSGLFLFQRTACMRNFEYFRLTNK